MVPGGLRRWWPIRHVPLGLIGALALVLAVELHIERHAIDYQGGSHWSYRIARLRVRNEARKSQILCFGDSLMRLGVIPTVIEAETGLRGYNFAQTGGQAAGSYFLYRQALANRAKPRAILIDAFPKLLAQNPDYNDDNYPFLATWRDALDEATVRRDPATFGRLLVGTIVPSVRSRTSVRMALQMAFEPSAISIQREILKSVRNWKLNRGAEVVNCRPGVVENLDIWEKGYFPRFTVDPANQAYLEKLLDLAQSNQTPVFWLLPPYQPQLQARCDRSGFDAAHEAFVRGMMARYPNLRVLDARHSGYPPEYFFDLHHLGREGAVVLSSDIGQQVSAALREPDAPNRWVTLPHFRMRLSPVPVEHVDESRMALCREELATQAQRLLR